MNEHDDEQEPPRRRTTGAGYPEESQPGMGIDAHDHAEDDVTPDVDPPKSDSERDSEPSKATGNPRAAGG